MEWVDKIKDIDLSLNKYSQMGEELVASFIFSNIGTTNKFFVDLGAGAYTSKRVMSNTKLLRETGWDGVMIDKNATTEGIKEYFLTPQNICEVLQGEKVPIGFDFLSIDIDSFDFYILDAALEYYKPRLVCVEFNSSLPVNSSLVIKYEEGYSFDGTNKYGFSFGAGKKLLAYHGYTLIYNHRNLDLFAVRGDIVSGDFNVKAEQHINFPINNEAIWESY